MPAIGIIAAVSGVVGTVAAVRSASAQRRAVALQEQQQQVATQRSRRQGIRQAQISRSQAISAGANLGGLFGSGLQGGISSLGSQLGSELGYSTQMSGLSRDISAAQRSAQRWGAISSLGFGVFNAVGGFQAFGSGGGGSSNPPPNTPAQAMPAGAYSVRPPPRPVYSRPMALPINAANPYGAQ